MDDFSHSRLRFGLLLTVQTVAVALLLWGAMPIYRTIMAAPGQQLHDLPTSPVVIVIALVAFHAAYWYRLRRVPIVLRRRSLLMAHLVIFAGRLSFIFGGSLFALVVFRHFPDLAEIADPFRLISRSLVMLVILFSLYCYTLELERVSMAYQPPA